MCHMTKIFLPVNVCCQRQLLYPSFSLHIRVHLSFLQASVAIEKAQLRLPGSPTLLDIVTGLVDWGGSKLAVEIYHKNLPQKDSVWF